MHIISHVNKLRTIKDCRFSVCHCFVLLSNPTRVCSQNRLQEGRLLKWDSPSQTVPRTLGFTEKTSIWPRLLVGYIAANGWLVTASHMWHQKEKGYSPFPETFPWEKLQHTRVNILDLKILQVFFKNRGEILVFEKMLNFLSFLVLLYVSGHFKQKIFFQNFSDW